MVGGFVLESLGVYRQVRVSAVRGGQGSYRICRSYTCMSPSIVIL